MPDFVPEPGDCWFCRRGEEGDELAFCWEFDCFVHEACVQEALRQDPRHPKAFLMAYWLGLDAEGAP